MTHYYLRRGELMLVVNAAARQTRTVRMPRILTASDFSGTPEAKKRWIQNRLADGTIGVLPSSIHAISAEQMAELSKLGYSVQMLSGFLATGAQPEAPRTDPFAQLVENGAKVSEVEEDVALIPFAGSLDVHDLRQAVLAADPTLPAESVTGLDKDQLMGLASTLKGSKRAAETLQETWNAAKSKL